ncbi:MAG: cupredoxin domain-containing protein [Anaerolineales bacterium]
MGRTRLVLRVLPFAVILLAGCAPKQQTISVTMSSFAFEPANLTASAGQTVRVLLDNPDTIPHAFDIPELGVGLAVIPEASVEIEFLATAPGTYVFFCGIEGHREAGMEGLLTVDP